MLINPYTVEFKSEELEKKMFLCHYKKKKTNGLCLLPLSKAYLLKMRAKKIVGTECVGNIQVCFCFNFFLLI